MAEGLGPQVNCSPGGFGCMLGLGNSAEGCDYLGGVGGVHRAHCHQFTPQGKYVFGWENYILGSPLPCPLLGPAAGHWLKAY